MHSIKSSILLVTLCCVTVLQVPKVSSAAVIRDCGSQSGELLSADVSPCPQSPCNLVIDSRVNLTLTFRSHVNTSSVTGRLWGLIGGLAFPYDLPHSDGCQSGISCPVTAQSTNTFRTSMTVSSAAPPGLRLAVRLRLEDERGQHLACVVFPARISA